LKESKGRALKRRKGEKAQQLEREKAIDCTWRLEGGDQPHWVAGDIGQSGGKKRGSIRTSTSLRALREDNLRVLKGVRRDGIWERGRREVERNQVCDGGGGKRLTLC